MKKLLVIILLCVVRPGICQDKQVMKVVRSVFEAMESQDSVLAARAFSTDARLSTVFIDADGSVQRRESEVKRLITAFGTPHEATWSEPIWNEQVFVDGVLATVWVDYAFYLDKELQHCGVDVFHLIHTSNGWKIFYLVDTRRKMGCKVPEKIKRRYR